jgi:hypothetical protein
MSVPRDLNFIDHMSELGWKESVNPLGTISISLKQGYFNFFFLISNSLLIIRNARFDKIIVDPSLYSRKNTKYLLSTATRKTPDAFKLFTGITIFSYTFLLINKLNL